MKRQRTACYSRLKINAVLTFFNDPDAETCLHEQPQRRGNGVPAFRHFHPHAHRFPPLPPPGVNRRPIDRLVYELSHASRPFQHNESAGRKASCRYRVLRSRDRCTGSGTSHRTQRTALSSRAGTKSWNRLIGAAAFKGQGWHPDYREACQRLVDAHEGGNTLNELRQLKQIHLLGTRSATRGNTSVLPCDWVSLGIFVCFCWRTSLLIRSCCEAQGLRPRCD